MMKRYFIAPRADVMDLAGTRALGTCHWIDLGSHGGSKDHVAVVLVDPHAEPGKEWQALPHLLDAKTPVGDSHLSAVGVEAHHTALEAAQILGKIHGAFRP